MKTTIDTLELYKRSRDVIKERGVEMTDEEFDLFYRVTLMKPNLLAIGIGEVISAKVVAMEWLERENGA